MGLENSAVQGGVIKASESFISLTNSKFLSNAAQEGGVLSLDNSGTLYAKGVTLRNNFASQVGGGIQILTYSSFDIIDSYFDGNYAHTASAINILQPSKVSLSPDLTCIDQIIDDPDNKVHWEPG